MFESGDAPDGRPSLHRPTEPVERPAGRFGLSLDTATHTPGPGGSPVRGLALVAAAAGVAALYVWDDLLLAAPIVAAASVWGAFSAWIIFSILYGGGSLVFATMAVHAYDRVRSGKPSRLAHWLQSHTEGRRGSWGRRLIDGGQLVGFVLSSFLLGGIVTTWLVRVVRPDKPVMATAVASCTIFGVTFTAQYAGIAALVL
jgi:hypothetical protein